MPLLPRFAGRPRLAVSSWMSPVYTTPLLHHAVHSVHAASPTASPTMSSSTASPTASPTRIHVDARNTGLWRRPQTDAAAAAVSALLQADLETHHVFFNDAGFHNHISHHLLSLYGTGAPPDALQQAYDGNAGYQRPARPPHGVSGGADGPAAPPDGPDALDWYETAAPAHLGQQVYYPDFLRFFQRDMERAGPDAGGPDAGWPAVVRRRLLAGTPAAEDLLVRLFAGFLHPLLQLMYGLEWAQPAIVAQGLAQAAVHRPQGVDRFLWDAEAAAAETPFSSSSAPSIRSLYEAVAASPALASAVRAADANKMTDGVLHRARDAIVALAARVAVPADDAAALAARTAEMAEACVYAAASAARHPRKHPKFDFFLIHHVNAVPFFLALNALDWVPLATKARLLAWKIRLDLLQYAARACPPLLDPAVLARYPGGADVDTPPDSADTATTTDLAPDTDGISAAAAAAAESLFRLDDDGHAIKLVRATALAERAARTSALPRPARIFASPAAWPALYRLETDAVRGPGATWVRTAGLDEAWEEVENEKQATYEP